MVELPNFTSVRENTILDEPMVLYPNSSTDLVNLNFSLLEDSNVNVYIYDMTGSVVKSSAIGFVQKSNINTTIDVNDLTSGLYFVSIQANK